MHFSRGLNSVNNLAGHLLSTSTSDDRFNDWDTVVIKRYWPGLGDVQVKEIASLCISALYLGLREAPMLLEHASVPIKHDSMKFYARWFVTSEVQAPILVKKP